MTITIRRATAADGDAFAVGDADGEVMGTLQLTFTSGLSRLGMTRTTVEARAQGCGVMQLTTDASRMDAHRFYERLGFTASRVGMKPAL